MKLIHIILGKANPERMNGVNKVVHAMATEQAHANWDVEVWGITSDLSINYPDRIFCTTLFKAQKNAFKIAPELVDRLKELSGGTVIHLHGGFIPVFHSISQLLKKLRIPYVFTPHGSYNTIALKKNLRVKQLYLPLFEKAILKNAAIIHCLGKSEVTGTKLIYKEATTSLIPYGFTIPEDMEVHPNDSGADFIVGFCGRLDMYTKGLDCLIKGFELFLVSVPNAQLWIIGDGDDKQALQNKVSPSAKQKIKFHGSKYGTEKIKLMQQLNVFAHPSRNEGLPTAVLEAASLGVPCLVSDATNMGEYITAYSCGEVIGEVTETAVGSALERLYAMVNTKTPHEILFNCMNMIICAFDWDKLLAQYREMYKSAFYARQQQ